MKSARTRLALSQRDYLAYTRRLKRLLTGHAVPEPVFDAAELLDLARRRFGSAMVAGLSAESLEWLLLMNSRAVATLAPPAQLDALQACLEQLVANAVPGDVIEAGCFRGGQCVFMSGVLKALGDTERRIIAADSFQGLPPPDLNLAPDDALMHFLLGSIGGFRASLNEVRDLLEQHGLLDERFMPVEGWFEHSLEQATIGRLALIRLDATYYESTRDALRILYPKLSRGGFVLCADYCAPTGARRAVDEYREAAGIEAPLQEVDGQGVLWQNGARAA